MILALKVSLSKKKKKVMRGKKDQKLSPVVPSVVWLLSIGLGERSAARMQFSRGFNWSLVGRGACVSTKERVHVCV